MRIIINICGKVHFLGNVIELSGLVQKLLLQFCDFFRRIKEMLNTFNGYERVCMYIAEEVGPMAAWCPPEELRQASDFQRKKNTSPIGPEPSLL